MREIDISNFYKAIAGTEKEVFHIRIFPFMDGSFLTLPVGVIGDGNGPIIVITAAQHGNEVNGTYCNHLIFKNLEGKNVKGKVIIFPITNPLAFTQRSRISSIDYVDMNRTYAFLKKRKPTEHLASLLFEEIISRADLLIDLHSGGPGEYLPVVEVYNEKLLTSAFNLNLGTILLINKPDNTLVSNCSQRDLPAFSIEMGMGLKVNREYCEKFFKGFMNYLVYQGMIAGKLTNNKKQKVLTGKKLVPAWMPGFFLSYIKLGQEIKEGDIIGEIEPLFQKEALKVKAPSSGTVVYLRFDDTVGYGDSLFHIGF